jgi:pimeloyl-ACP methyl ester carboxylesterase
MRKSFCSRLGARRRGLCLLAAFALWIWPAVVHAEPVQIKPSLLRLNGNLELPPDRTPADGVALILHGMLSHHRQDTIAALQKNLRERGIGSLAITLSLGVDDRQGPRTCDVLHDYALAGARRELGLWIAWLNARGAPTVDLVGFARGGAQIAALAADLPSVRKVVLLAPAFTTTGDQADAYQRAFGQALQPHLDAARSQPLQQRTVDFLLCKQAPVLGATFLDGYTELPPHLAASIGKPTLVVIAGKDEVVPDLAGRLPAGVRRVTIDDAGHFFPDRQGEATADAIAKFLKEPDKAP